MHKTLRTLCLLALSLGAVAADAPAARAAPAPFQIKGFRSAHFGMTADQVRAAIQHDFKVGPDAVREFDNDVEKTRVVVVALPALEPGPGPASVSYILGATSRKLMHVNVMWSSPDQPSNDERAKIAAAGLQLTHYFRQQTWKPDGVTTAVPSGPNGLVLFAGIDPNNALVEVRLTGVAITGASAPAPTGPARLRVAYAATIGKQDVAAPVKQGSF
ncbi:hypothetical protein CDN99_01335 [Roseateles aquatilis]|uniref:Uncharacterized protein n=1 Tax=Roseateles aquatilis TaxID=431061 RepID=A0A246JKN1_9BURK|nr:hypothetical protein [Roseateles aquatilis]OWQ93171.1 hypothetical protein CDN99_01335 [Roseateles aquatilis]